MSTIRSARTIQGLVLCLAFLATACATTAPTAVAAKKCWRGTLGIEPDDITSAFRSAHHLPNDLQGSLVALAIDGGPAAAAGIRKGDVLLQIGDKHISNSCEATEVLFDGNCDPSRIAVWRDGARLEMTVTPASERTFLRQKCDEGIPAACFRLGWLIWSGTGFPADEKKGLELYRGACDSGWPEACAYLGLHLIDTSESEVEIVNALQRACDLGSSAGCAHLAYLYATGTKVERDDAHATRLYVRSCDLGDPLGCYNVGLMYNAARGVARDRARAIAAYDEGCRGGSASACTDLGWFYQYGEGVAKNEARAFELYGKGCTETSCQSANRRGCVNLGLAYRDGIGTVVDPSHAAEIFQAACEEDTDSDDPNAHESQVHACSLLGAMYLEGQGVDRNDELGLTHSQRGCEGGDAFGCFNAAVVFANGLGVDVDMTEAARYYGLACDSDDGEGCYKLSQLYADGSGVERDEGQAKKLAQKACGLGFDAACGK